MPTIFDDIDNDWLISEIEEELSEDSLDWKEGAKKIYSLSKFSKMFWTIYADHFDLEARKGGNLSMLGDNPIDEVSNDSDQS